MTTSVGTAIVSPCKMGAADVVIVRRSVVKGRRVVKTEVFCVRPPNPLDCRAMARATASTITPITANAVVVVAARKRAR